MIASEFRFIGSGGGGGGGEGGGLDQREPEPLLVLVHKRGTEGLEKGNHSFKAAKYEIQKPSTCRAKLFRCKFWVDFSRFSSCVINLSRNKTICCWLKKCSTNAEEMHSFWATGSFSHPVPAGLPFTELPQSIG